MAAFDRWLESLLLWRDCAADERNSGRKSDEIGGTCKRIEAVRSVEAGEGVGSVSDELIFSSQRS